MDVQVSKKARKYYNKLVKSENRSSYQNIFVSFYQDDNGYVLEEEIQKTCFKNATDRHLKIVDDELFLYFKQHKYIYQFYINAESIKLYLDDASMNGVHREITYDKVQKLDYVGLLRYMFEEAKELIHDFNTPSKVINKNDILFSFNNIKAMITKPYKEYQRVLIITTIIFLFFLYIVIAGIGNAKAADYIYISLFGVFFIGIYTFTLIKMVPIAHFARKYRQDEKEEIVNGKVMDLKILTKSYSGEKFIYGIILKIDKKKYLFPLPQFTVFDSKLKSKILRMFLGKDVTFSYYEDSRILNVKNSSYYKELVEKEEN